MACALCSKNVLKDTMTCPACGGLLVANLPPALGKSKMLAALLTVPFPGAGHLYCGQIYQGIGLMMATWLLLLSVMQFSPTGAFVVHTGWIAYLARDAWRTAETATVEAAQNLVDRPDPGGWLLWTWAALRAGWILGGFGLFGALAAWNGAAALSDGSAGTGALWLALAAALGAGIWTQGRYTIRVVSGAEYAPPAVLRGERLWTLAAGGGVLVLSAIALPMFAGLFRKSGEGAGKGNLGALRSALSIYAQDRNGQRPAALSELTAAGKYLSALPPAKTPNFHADSASVRNATAADDRGGWVYDNVPGDANYGQIWVNCTHTDTRGTRWDAY